MTGADAYEAVLKLAERSILAFRLYPPPPVPEKAAAIDPYAESTLLPDVSQPFDVTDQGVVLW